MAFKDPEALENFDEEEAVERLENLEKGFVPLTSVSPVIIKVHLTAIRIGDCRITGWQLSDQKIRFRIVIPHFENRIPLNSQITVTLNPQHNHLPEKFKDGSRPHGDVSGYILEHGNTGWKGKYLVCTMDFLDDDLEKILSFLKDKSFRKDNIEMLKLNAKTHLLLDRVPLIRKMLKKVGALADASFDHPREVAIGATIFIGGLVATGYRMQVVDAHEECHMMEQGKSLREGHYVGGTREFENRFKHRYLPERVVRKCKEKYGIIVEREQADNSYEKTFPK